MTLAGASAVLNLRLLGIARQIPLAAFRVIVPVVWGSFWLNAVTGTLLFFAYATTRSVMPLFFIKMALVVAGITAFARIQRVVVSSVPVEAGVSSRTRMLAAASLGAWAAAITAGRLLAYAEY